MDIYIKALLYAIPIFGILILLEIVVASRKKIQINHAADMISSLSSGITNTTRDGIQFSFILISYSWLVDCISIIQLDKLWLSIIIAFISQDFAGYWLHRLSHRVNFMWNRHVIHHSSEEFNLSCALRQSISDNIRFSAILLIPAAVLGIPSHIFAIIGPVHLFLQFWYHTRLIDKMGILENFLVTPSHHRVHHAINRKYLDKNYGQIFIIWDKIFGTFQSEEKNNLPIYGILRPANTWNPVSINFKHILQLAKDAYQTQRNWDKIRIWFMPTGWRPNDVIEDAPINTIEDSILLKKYFTNNSKLLLSWSYCQLTTALIYMFYIFFKIPLLTTIMEILLAGLLFLHIISYTTLLDGKKVSILFELLKISLGIILFIIINNIINFASNFVSNFILTYLLISFIMTIYFINTEVKYNKVKIIK